MAILGKINSSEGEYFLYRRTSKFISEALIILSSVVALSAVAVLISLGIELKASSTDNGSGSDSAASSGSEKSVSSKDIKLGLFLYTIVILLVSICDLITATILNTGIRKLKLTYCLFWQGGTITSLLVTGMLTLAFITMVNNVYPLIGYIPSLIAKPFSLWIVKGFITELRELRTFPWSSVKDGQTILHPPAKPTFSLSDLEAIKNTTTVFYMNKKFGKVSDGNGNSQSPHYMAATKLKSIPE